MSCLIPHPSASAMPADERRLRWITPGARVLRNTDLHVLAGGPPEPEPEHRTCPRPSPWRAARYRAGQEMRAVASEMLLVFGCVAPFALVYVVWLYSTAHA